MARPTDPGDFMRLYRMALDVADSIEQVTDPQYASYAQGVADTLAWLSGAAPRLSLVHLLRLDN